MSQLNGASQMSPEEVRALIRGGETEQVELKLEDVFQTDIAEILMSMANAGGESFLIIGVEDHPIKIRGVFNIKEVTDKIYNAARQVVPSLAHMIAIEKHSLDNKNLLLVRVPPNLPGVYHVNGRYLRRRGSQRLPVQAEELLRLMHLRGGGYYEDQPVPGATIADINPERVGWYIARRQSQRSSLLPAEQPVEEFLDKLGLLQSGHPTVAALLFFGRNPQQFFPYHVIRAMRFADNTTARIIDRKDIGGTIPEMIEQTLAFVMANTRHPVRFEGAIRYDEDEYPVEAVREAIANACAHRDMSVTNGQLRVFIFANRLLVDSPGELLPGVKIERLAQISRLRNPRLAQLLYDSGYMERAGTGISRMIGAMEEHGLEPPIFEEVANSLQVTLRGPEYEKAWKAPPARILEPLVTPELRANLNNRQLRFLSMLREREQMSRKEYETTFEVSERTANNDLLALVRKGLITTVGNSVRTVYVLKR
ncbi:MAG TPA: ATP-binding protein [Chloroflexia bacterium]|nr:ATP-binding protein [Chloroflexia bacterium]